MTLRRALLGSALALVALAVAAPAAPKEPRLAVPVLYVVASEDAGFPDAAQTLYDATATADKRLLVVSGSGHGNQVLAIAEARAALDGFIDRVSSR